MNRICSCCGTSSTTIFNGLCQNCKSCFDNGGSINPLPKPGTVAYDKNGYVICHICGRSYRKLGGHIYGAHHIKIGDYKKQFGLCNNTKLTESNYSKQMHDYAYKYSMPEQLIRTGVNTRISKENCIRKGKGMRLQQKLFMEKIVKKHKMC